MPNAPSSTTNLSAKINHYLLYYILFYIIYYIWDIIVWISSHLTALKQLSDHEIHQNCLNNTFWQVMRIYFFKIHHRLSSLLYFLQTYFYDFGCILCYKYIILLLLIISSFSCSGDFKKWVFIENCWQFQHFGDKILMLVTTKATKSVSSIFLSPTFYMTYKYWCHVTCHPHKYGFECYHHDRLKPTGRETKISSGWHTVVKSGAPRTKIFNPHTYQKM